MPTDEPPPEGRVGLLIGSKLIAEETPNGPPLSGSFLPDFLLDPAVSTNYLVSPQDGSLSMNTFRLWDTLWAPQALFSRVRGYRGKSYGQG